MICDRSIRDRAIRSLDHQITSRQSAITRCPTPLVAVIMGSTSDWETMQHAVEVLEQFGVPYEKHVVSAHRTPVWMAEFAQGAEARGIRGHHRRRRRRRPSAGHDGGPHRAARARRPGADPPRSTASTRCCRSCRCRAACRSATLAIGKAGATNAGLLAVAILATSRPDLRERLRAFRDEQTATVREARLP